MAFSQSDVDTLKAAIASGVLSVRYVDGRQVTYRSQAELERALALASSELSPAGATRLRSFVAGF